MTRQIDVQLFGAFRQYGNGAAALPVTVSEPATVGALREAFAARLDDNNARSLLEASVFATDEAMLQDADPLPDATISVLPPVCGG